MKGSDIIALIKNAKLENYDFKVHYWSNDWETFGITSLEITGIGDIGHADKIATLETKEVD